jgi:hypothetical protein
MEKKENQEGRKKGKGTKYYPPCCQVVNDEM